jgi:hypothetical protein
MSAAYDIANYLASIGEGTVGTDLFVADEPAAPELALCVTLYDTGGDLGQSYVGYQDPTIQIRCRAISYLTGYAKLEDIRDALVQSFGFDYGDWHYTGFWLISDIASIGRDENRRELLTLNLRLMREPLET